MYIFGSGEVGGRSASRDSQQVLPSLVLFILAYRGAWPVLHSLDAVICESGTGVVPLTNGDSTAHEGARLKFKHSFQNIICIFTK